MTRDLFDLLARHSLDLAGEIRPLPQPENLEWDSSSDGIAEQAWAEDQAWGQMRLREGAAPPAETPALPAAEFATPADELDAGDAEVFDIRNAVFIPLRAASGESEMDDPDMDDLFPFGNGAAALPAAGGSTAGIPRVRTRAAEGLLQDSDHTEPASRDGGGGEEQPGKSLAAAGEQVPEAIVQRRVAPATENTGAEADAPHAPGDEVRRGELGTAPLAEVELPRQGGMRTGTPSESPMASGSPEPSIQRPELTATLSQGERLVRESHDGSHGDLAANAARALESTTPKLPSAEPIRTSAPHDAPIAQRVQTPVEFRHDVSEALAQGDLRAEARNAAPQGSDVSPYVPEVPGPAVPRNDIYAVNQDGPGDLHAEDLNALESEATISRVPPENFGVSPLRPTVPIGPSTPHEAPIIQRVQTPIGALPEVSEATEPGELRAVEVNAVELESANSQLPSEKFDAVPTGPRDPISGSPPHGTPGVQHARPDVSEATGLGELRAAELNAMELESANSQLSISKFDAVPMGPRDPISVSTPHGTPSVQHARPDVSELTGRGELRAVEVNAVELESANSQLSTAKFDAAPMGPRDPISGSPPDGTPSVQHARPDVSELTGLGELRAVEVNAVELESANSQLPIEKFGALPMGLEDSISGSTPHGAPIIQRARPDVSAVTGVGDLRAAGANKVELESASPKLSIEKFAAVPLAPRDPIRTSMPHGVSIIQRAQAPMGARPDASELTGPGDLPAADVKAMELESGTPKLRQENARHSMPRDASGDFLSGESAIGTPQFSASKRTHEGAGFQGSPTAVDAGPRDGHLVPAEAVEATRYSRSQDTPGDLRDAKPETVAPDFGASKRALEGTGFQGSQTVVDAGPRDGHLVPTAAVEATRYSTSQDTPGDLRDAKPETVAPDFGASKRALEGAGFQGSPTAVDAGPRDEHLVPAAAVEATRYSTSRDTPGDLRDAKPETVAPDFGASKRALEGVGFQASPTAVDATRDGHLVPAAAVEATKYSTSRDTPGDLRDAKPETVAPDLGASKRALEGAGFQGSPTAVDAAPRDGHLVPAAAVEATRYSRSQDTPGDLRDAKSGAGASDSTTSALPPETFAAIAEKMAEPSRQSAPQNVATPTQLSMPQQASDGSRLAGSLTNDGTDRDAAFGRRGVVPDGSRAEAINVATFDSTRTSSPQGAPYLQQLHTPGNLRPTEMEAAAPRLSATQFIPDEASGQPVQMRGELRAEATRTAASPEVSNTVVQRRAESPTLSTPELVDALAFRPIGFAEPVSEVSKLADSEAWTDTASKPATGPGRAPTGGKPTYSSGAKLVAGSLREAGDVVPEMRDAEPGLSARLLPATDTGTSKSTVGPSILRTVEHGGETGGQVATVEPQAVAGTKALSLPDTSLVPDERGARDFRPEATFAAESRTDGYVDSSPSKPPDLQPLASTRQPSPVVATAAFGVDVRPSFARTEATREPGMAATAVPQPVAVSRKIAPVSATATFDVDAQESFAAGARIVDPMPEATRDSGLAAGSALRPVAASRMIPPVSATATTDFGPRASFARREADREPGTPMSPNLQRVVPSRQSLPPSDLAAQLSAAKGSRIADSRSESFVDEGRTADTVRLETANSHARKAGGKDEPVGLTRSAPAPEAASLPGISSVPGEPIELPELPLSKRPPQRVTENNLTAAKVFATGTSPLSVSPPPSHEGDRIDPRPQVVRHDTSSAKPKKKVRNGGNPPEEGVPLGTRRDANPARPEAERKRGRKRTEDAPVESVAPAIRIHIGRVRLTPRVASRPRQVRPGPTLSLGRYLSARGGKT